MDEGNLLVFPDVTYLASDLCDKHEGKRLGYIELHAPIPTAPPPMITTCLAFSNWRLLREMYSFTAFSSESTNESNELGWSITAYHEGKPRGPATLNRAITANRNMKCAFHCAEQ